MFYLLGDLFLHQRKLFLFELGVLVEFVVVFVDAELAADALVAHFARADNYFREVVLGASFYVLLHTDVC